jgi:hypothetical protein
MLDGLALRARRALPVGRISGGLALAIVLASAPAHGQSGDRPENNSFHVTWQPRPDSAIRAVEGRVHSGLSARVTNVRLRVEGFAGDGRPVGKTYAWVVGDVAPGGDAYFAVEPIPQAASYRVGVVSFDVVSPAAVPGLQAP